MPKGLQQLREEGRDRIAVVGFCQDSREYTPYEDQELVIVGLNRAYIFQQRADAWFDMHSPDIVTNQSRRPGGHLEYLRRFPGPVYMHYPQEEIPNAVEYPLTEVAQTVAGNIYRRNAKGEVTPAVDEPYLTSSIAQQIALAIHLGFKEIGVYGVDLNTESEYYWQRPGVEFMLGLAAGRGIKVILPDNCPMLRGNIYGRGYLTESGERMSLEQLQTRAANLSKEQATLTAQINELTGARKELAFVQAQMVPGLDHELLDQRRQKMEQLLGDLQGKLLQTAGSIKETAYWIHQTPSGQDPREAVAQYRQSHGAEGPVTEYDALTYEENPAGKAAECDAEQVGDEFEPAIV